MIYIFIRSKLEKNSCVVVFVEEVVLVVEESLAVVNEFVLSMVSVVFLIIRGCVLSNPS